MSSRWLSYEPAGSSEPIPLCEGGALAGPFEGVRGRSWGYELGYRDLASVERVARECELEVVFEEPSVADRLRRAADGDVSRRTPGRFTCGEWSQRAYILGAEPSGIVRGRHSSKLKVALLDGVWRRLRMFEFNPVADGGGSYLDLPYDTPYDLKMLSARTELDGPAWADAPVRIVVYGPVANPEVTVGGNIYAVSCDVESGGYLVVDGAERRVYTVSPTGFEVNRFAQARRGTGAGSGEYIFEKVKPGSQPVSWSFAFGFDLGYYEEEGEIPWTSS